MKFIVFVVYFVLTGDARSPFATHSFVAEVNGGVALIYVFILGLHFCRNRYAAIPTPTRSMYLWTWFVVFTCNSFTFPCYYLYVRGVNKRLSCTSLPCSGVASAGQYSGGRTSPHLSCVLPHPFQLGSLRTSVPICGSSHLQTRGETVAIAGKYILQFVLSLCHAPSLLLGATHP
jgi:hypothetical protein